MKFLFIFLMILISACSVKITETSEHQWALSRCHVVTAKLDAARAKELVNIWTDKYGTIEEKDAMVTQRKLDLESLSILETGQIECENYIAENGDADLPVSELWRPDA